METQTKTDNLKGKQFTYNKKQWKFTGEKRHNGDLVAESQEKHKKQISVAPTALPNLEIH